MSFKRMAVLCSALLCGSACQAEPVSPIESSVLKTDVGWVMLMCPEGYQLQPSFQLTCWLNLRILIDDILWKKGGYGRSICPPPSMTEYRPLYDAITEYILAKKPHDVLSTTIASIALKDKFPCPSPLNFR